MRKLYRFTWGCGRMGNVEGVFIAAQDDVDAALGRHVYFGEILGKHSEIDGVLEAGDLEVLSEDQAFIDQLQAVFKGRSPISGYSPLDYLDEEEEA